LEPNLTIGSKNFQLKPQDVLLKNSFDFQSDLTLSADVEDLLRAATVDPYGKIHHRSNVRRPVQKVPADIVHALVERQECEIDPAEDGGKISAVSGSSGHGSTLKKGW